MMLPSGRALGEMMPYGAGAAYDTSTGTYVDLATGKHYPEAGSLHEAMYAEQVRALAAQEPFATSTMLTPGGPGMVYYPSPQFRALPSGVLIPEERYQQALREGNLEVAIAQYEAMAAAQPFSFQRVEPGTMTLITQPNQAVLGPDRTLPTQPVIQPTITRLNGEPAPGPGVMDWIQANQTTLLIAGAAAVALVLFTRKQREQT